MKFTSFTALTNEELDNKINDFLNSAPEIEIINFNFTSIVNSEVPHVTIICTESLIINWT